MVAVMGTSTCHMMNGAELGRRARHVRRRARTGIVPGLYGYEAGESGVGDIWAWSWDNRVLLRYHDEARERGIGLHDLALAAAVRAGARRGGARLALDWHNGNRSVPSTTSSAGRPRA